LEIVEAGWYGPEEPPEIPSKISIARALIDRFITQYQKTA
jgi:NADH pyrophosphatase NudC (nudix superfamily)